MVQKRFYIKSETSGEEITVRITWEDGDTVKTTPNPDVVKNVVKRNNYCENIRS